MLKADAKVSAFDPEGMENVKKVLGDKIEYAENPYDILDGADALVIATEWGIFRAPNFDEIAKRMKNKLIFDGRNILTVEKMNELGFQYYSIGRKPIN